MKIKCIIFDFDGVFTDNTVYTSASGEEFVKSSKADSVYLSFFKKSNSATDIVVITSEINQSVVARCEKLKLNCIQTNDKLTAATKYLASIGRNLEDAAFLCNDINDIELAKSVGCAVGVRDSAVELHPYLDLILTRNGGNGAVREFLTLITNNLLTLDINRLSTPPKEPMNKDIGKRPWGTELLQYHIKGAFTVKDLFINKGCKGGLQKHHFKNEVGFLVSGSLLVRYDPGNGHLNEIIYKPGDYFHFQPGCVHQEEALEDCHIIECSTPHFNDRVRLEEKYFSSLPEGLPSTLPSEVIFG